ncbi:MAG: hypothetical protein JWM61_2012 [Micrococcaceae bacterium]|nr:hypothetical protein [Micrococcaceae bacterium]
MISPGTHHRTSSTRRAEPQATTTALAFSASARKLGIMSAVGTLVLSVLYVITLAAGLLTLPSQDKPIGDPLFTILES